jgi:type II secretory pathway pseudopilin PulG
MRQTKPIRKAGKGGFSLVEVVLALGIVAFALLSIMALLPAGISTNKVSTEEMHATDLLSLLTADLRNTHPSLNASKSLLFHLTLPYVYVPAVPAASGPGVLALASSAQIGGGNYASGTTLLTSLPYTYTMGVDNYDSPVPPATNVAYQVTVIYTQVPVAATSTSANSPVQARLIVSWPCLAAATTMANFTDTTKVRGYVEAYVTYPAP